METKIYRVTLTLSFDIDATSEEVAREKANIEAVEWLRNVENVDDEEISVKLLGN